MQKRMRSRNLRGRRERPLLQSAPRSERHEDEVDMAVAEILIGFSHTLWDEYDAQQNSTAISTEMETGKQVEVRSVNPSMGDQDREERVTPVANALEVNREVGTGKQPGEGAEELTGQGTPSAIAIAELRGASNLNLLLIDESESDSELPSWPHPSSAPEGSLLHALHLQILGAGRDGITVQELFKCLKTAAEVLAFGSDWKVEVRRHLKNNPYFCEEKGYHYLVCDHQLEVQQPSNKSSPANIASTSRGHGASSSKTVLLDSLHSTPPTMQTGLSVDTNEGVVQTRRKAFQKANAALSEQATEFEEMHQSTGVMQIMPSSVADSQLVLHGPLSTSSKKRNPSSSDAGKLPDHGHPIPGDLQASQAAILAKTEVQTGDKCVVLKNDNGNWQCDNMAMAGDTHCYHHRRSQRLESSQVADAQQGKQGATMNLQPNQDSSILGLPGSHPNLDQSSLSLHPKPATISPSISREAAKHVDKPATAVSNHDEDSDEEQLKQQMPKNVPKNVPKRHHVAARKPATNVGSLKSQGLIRTPTTPPLPPPYGRGRKAPVKDGDQ